MRSLYIFGTAVLTTDSIVQDQQPRISPDLTSWCFFLN